MRLRWFQFRLRTLLLLTFVLAVGLGAWNAYVAPYRQQRRVMAAIERAGGTYEVRASGPRMLRKWLDERSFRDIVRVEICDQAARECLDEALSLPRLESLCIEGRSFTDQHVPRLAVMKTLKEVELYGSAVTRDVLDALEQSRPDLAVHMGLSFDDLVPVRYHNPPGLSSVQDEEQRSHHPRTASQWAGRTVRLHGGMLGITKATSDAQLTQLLFHATLPHGGGPLYWSCVTVTLREDNNIVRWQKQQITVEGTFDLMTPGDVTAYQLKNAVLLLPSD